MKQAEIQVGSFYKAKVNDRLVTVKVLRTREVFRISPKRSSSRAVVYDVENQSTKRVVTFRSAARFREKVGYSRQDQIEDATNGRR
jgi:hypothetical protein